MYSSERLSSSGAKKPKSTSYLVRPKLGPLRYLYNTRPLSAYSTEKRKKLKRSVQSAVPKMDFIRRKPDYADIAYTEAVGRLRILLAESYTPVRSRIYSRPIRELDSAGEETDNQSMISAVSRTSRVRPYYGYSNIYSTPRKYNYPLLSSRSNAGMSPRDAEKTIQTDPIKYDTSTSTAPPELMSFIERQDNYIEQLEKESSFCKEELSSLLLKVKEVISENEHLHGRQKSKLLKSVFDQLETETETETEIEREKRILKSPSKTKKTRILEGPLIVFESRISELEAQLTQAKIELRKALEENESMRNRMIEPLSYSGAGYDTFRKQLDECNKEKEDMRIKIRDLQSALSKVRDKETDISDKVKRSLDVAEQAQYEKNAAELEIRRLKDELERQHLKLRDAIGDQGRKIADERSATERRYTQQIEQLTAELGVQWESANRTQLEMDKLRRENSDLRRETAQKQALIDDMKKDMQNKIITLQSDIGVSGAEKSALEQQIGTLQMANERTERQYKQEITRLQAEIQSLRQRLDRADADLIHSRRENIRLSEQVASLEKELKLNNALSEERAKTPRSNEIMALPPPAASRDNREKELTSMIEDMENKHAATVAGLEGMIYSQNQLMDKLSSECHLLTQKLEDASLRHKEEIRELQTSLDRLNNSFIQSQLPTTNVKDDHYRPVINSRNSPTAQASPTSQPKTQTVKAETSPKTNIISSKKVLPVVQAMPNTENAELETQEYKVESNQQYTVDPNNQQQPYVAEDPTDQQYDPNAQYTEEYDATQQQYYPNQEYNPNDPSQQYDPNLQYDPNDPNQQYDPNDLIQQYDPNDPSQQYDPNYQYDPNIQYDLDQQYPNDPNQQYPVDPNQQQYLKQDYDPNQQYDPNQLYENPNQQYEEDIADSKISKEPLHYQGDIADSTISKKPQHYQGDNADSKISVEPQYYQGDIADSKVSEKPQHCQGDIVDSKISEKPEHYQGDIADSKISEDPQHYQGDIADSKVSEETQHHKKAEDGKEKESNK